MARTPTDLAILDFIYNEYYPVFSAYVDDKPNRSAKIYVPLDIQKIADHFKVDKDIVFGRLYFDLEKRYGYRKDNAVAVPFFSLEVGKDEHCINFPYAASVLADLRDKNNKYRLSIGLSVTSLVISVVAICISLL